MATIARPVAVSLAGDLYHPHRRGRALAALDAGQAAGTAVCFILGALAVHFLSWRWLFWGLAAAGSPWPRAPGASTDPTRSRPPGRSLWTVLRALVRIRTNGSCWRRTRWATSSSPGVASFSVLFITERYGLSTAPVDALAPLVAIGRDRRHRGRRPAG